MQVSPFRILPQNMVHGDIIPLKTSREGHNNGVAEASVHESPAVNFADALNLALQKVNDQQVQSEQLNVQMVADPGSVEAHTVMIAAEKARISLTFAKTITDLAIRTYRELSSLR